MPRKSRMRGRASVVRRSRKSHIRSPRRVTLAPIELPVRTRNWAIERLALVTIGFWPVMVVRSPSAASSALALVRASPRPMLTTIFESRGTWFGLPYSNCFCERRHDLGLVALLEPAGHDFTSSCSPQWRQTRTRRPLSSVAWAIRVGLPQLRADEHDLADRHRLGDLEDAALLDLRHAVGRARRLARLGVALGDVEALDDDADATGRRAAAEDAAGRASARPGGG